MACSNCSCSTGSCSAPKTRRQWPGLKVALVTLAGRAWVWLVTHGHGGFR